MSGPERSRTSGSASLSGAVYSLVAASLVMAVTRGLPPDVVDVAAAAVRGERRLSAETTASSSCAILGWAGWFGLDVWCCDCDRVGVLKYCSAPLASCSRSDCEDLGMLDGMLFSRLSLVFVNHGIC